MTSADWGTGLAADTVNIGIVSNAAANNVRMRVIFVS